MSFVRCRKCRKCGEYGRANCDCVPFQVIDEDGDESTVYAKDFLDYGFEDAAKSWAKESNEYNDYWLMDESVTVTVTNPDGESKAIRVSAHPDIHYSAREITSNDTPEVSYE